MSVKSSWKFLLVIVFVGTSPALHAHTDFSWTNAAAPKIYFTITGSTDTSTAVHRVTLTVDTGGIAATGFTLHNPAAGSDITILPSQLPWSTTTPAKQISLTQSLPGHYVLQIDQLPNTTPRGYITSTEEWFITVNGLSVPNTVATSIRSQNWLLAAATTSNVRLNVPPQVSISTNPPAPPAISAGQTVDFTQSCFDLDKPISSYAWTFGGGVPASATSASVAGVLYSGATGTYPATVTLTDSLGQTGSASVTVSVTNNPPSPSVATTPSPANIRAGRSVSYSASVVDEFPATVSYSWTFSGGSPSTGTGPGPITVTYATAGSYTTSLAVTDNAAQAGNATLPVNVSVNNPPVPSIATNPNPPNILAGLAVTFQGSVTDEDPSTVTYAWTFPGGSPASAAGPGPHTVTFSAPGSYAVTLTAADDIARTGSASSTVNVSANNPPVPSITTNPSPPDIAPGNAVTFSASATDESPSTVTYVWSFPGGSPSTATGAGLISVTYAAAGTYTASLFATDNIGQNVSTSVNVHVAVNNPPAPSISTTPTPPDIMPGQTVIFQGSVTDESPSTVTYAWTFPGGSPGSAVGSGPHTVTFAAAGTYIVSLVGTDNIGQGGNASVTVHVIVNNPPAPTIHATPDPANIRAGHTVSYTATVVDESPLTVTYTWTFPGGSPSAGTGSGPIVVTYATAGSYTTGLVAADNIGQNVSNSVIVNVSTNNPPVPSITPAPNPPNIRPGQTVTFTGSAIDEDQSSVTCAWAFPGGNPPTATGIGPISVTYATVGSYTASLTTTDDIGQDGATSVMVNVTANQAPVALFTTTPPSVNAPATINFDSSASYDPDGTIASRSWSFGEIGSSTGVSPAHDYDNPGQYTVQLTVTDNEGATDTRTVILPIYPNQNVVFAFPGAYGVPYDPSPPVIDGTVAEDTGWRGAHRLTYDGGTDPDVAIQGLRDRVQDSLYLSYEVRNDPTIDDTDVIVLCFRPDSAHPDPAKDIKVFVYPFAAGQGPSTGVAPASVLIWKNSSSWTALSPAEVMACNLDIKLKSYPMGSSNAWDVEMKIPTSIAAGGAKWEDFANRLLIYSDVVRASTTGSVPVYTQFRLPRGAPEVTGDLTAYPFLPSWWSPADKSLSVASKGISLRWNDIGTANTPPSRIELPTAAVPNVTNVFHANVQNESQHATTAGVVYDAVPNVHARFRIANWGIPAYGEWKDIPAAPNPTANQTLAAGSATGPSETVFSLNWSLDAAADAALIANYQPPNQHQCVLVDIDAGSGADIVTSSVVRNMDFGNASEFQRDARIGTTGYGMPPAGRQKHKISLEVTMLPWAAEKTASTDDRSIRTTGGTPAVLTLPPTIAAGGKDRPTSYVRWVASGYLETDDYLIVKGVKLYRRIPIGSFGYIIRHDGPVERWTYRLAGARKVGENRYLLEISPNDFQNITTTIVPEEIAQTLSAGVHGGTAVPLSSLGNDHTTGYAAALDVDYRFAQNWSATALGGIEYFPGKPGADPAFWLNLAAGARLHAGIARGIWAFAGAYGGLYLKGTGALAFGADAGAGLTWVLSRSIAVEARTDYHRLWDSDGTSFLTATVGLILRF